MDAPPLPQSSTPTTIPATPPKLRLMCSYGGHIVPRPQTNSLYYAGGDTRIIALDRRTTAASLSALTTHLSRTLFNNRPFYLKYQIPNEDLDSLVSVTNDEDFQNMLEEHEAAGSTRRSRIRLFLFPMKPESLGLSLDDRKSDSWFSEALTIIQRGHYTGADSGREFLGLDTVGVTDSDQTLQAQGDSMKSNGGGDGSGNGGEAKVVGGKLESFVLETSSSFGSTSSLVSMANLPAIAVHAEGDSVGLLEKKVRVPSSASIESDNGVGSANFPSKKEIQQEKLIQAASGVPSINVEMESSITDQPSTINMQKALQLSEYHLPPQAEGKHLQYELPYAQGGLQYPNQFSTDQSLLASYYPVYQLPVQHQVQSPYLLNQPHPIYLVPVRPNANYSMSIEGSLTENANASRPPLLPLSAVDQTPRAYNEVVVIQQMTESVKTNHPISSTTPVVVAPLTHVKQQFADPPELSKPSRTVTTAYVTAPTYVSEFNDRLAYTQIYKTQPPAPALPPKYQTSKEITVVPSESSTKQ